MKIKRIQSNGLKRIDKDDISPKEGVDAEREGVPMFTWKAIFWMFLLLFKDVK